MSDAYYGPGAREIEVTFAITGDPDGSWQHTVHVAAGFRKIAEATCETPQTAVAAAAAFVAGLLRANGADSDADFEKSVASFSDKIFESRTGLKKTISEGLEKAKPANTKPC